MHILQITNKMPYPPKDGGAVATLNWSRHAAMQGNKVTILAFNTAKHYTPLYTIPRHIKQLIQFEAVELNNNTNLPSALFNLLFSRLPYTANRFMKKQYTAKLITLLTENSYDVIQIEGVYMCYYINIIRKYAPHALIVFRAHNIEHEIWQRAAHNTRNVLKKMYLKILTRRIEKFETTMLNQYDVLLPITPRDALKFTDMGNTKPSLVTPVGVDVLSPPLQPYNNNKIGYLGALDWYPNVEGLLWFITECMPLIKKKINGFVLHVAGRNAPKKLIKTLKKHGVHFDGEVENANDYIDRFGVMIVPIMSGGGMRVKIVEALARGKAVVTTTIGAEGVHVTNNVHAAITDSATEYANAVVKLLTDNDYRLIMGNKALQFVQQHYNNATITQKTLQFYEQQINSIGSE